MLKIEKMEITGFKSFPDSTEVVFPAGITAVVGPNGCGKSNIGDAINWVLGEQSARMMRGSSMQDVIFNGSEARRPQGLAEVSLHLVGRVAGAGADRNHITITRRLFRSGESDYLLNGAKSRLRDIQDLLREERVGAQTYATIEQGRIDQILNAKPKDRRLIIEEAAGIAGFKHKRRLAELKLEATHANLLRVHDIVLEVARQINALKRQAARARRYGRLRDALREKEAVRFGAKARRMDSELLARREAESRARDTEATAAAQLAVLEAAVVAERTALEDAERQGRAAAETLHRLEIEIDRAEARVVSCRERIAESGEASERLAGDIAALEERYLAAEAEAGLRAERLREEEAARGASDASAETLRQRVSASSEALESRRGEVETLRRGLFESMNRLADLRNRRRSVEEHAQRLDAQRERLEREREDAQRDLLRASEEAAGLGARSESQRKSVIELRAEVARAEDGLARARAACAEEGESLAAAREREASASVALRTLEDVATRFAGASDGVRLLLTAGASAGVRTAGVVADFVEASREMEGAADAYLSTLLPAVVVEDDADACRAAALIRSEGAGRTVLLSKSQPSGALAIGVASNGQAPLPDAMRGDPRVLGRLKDHMRLRQADGFVSSRIGDAVLVDSLDAALALHRVHPHVDYLATSGDVVYASGVIAAGGPAIAGRGLLAHNRRLADAQVQLAEATARTAALATGLEASREAVRGAESELAARRAELERAADQGNEIEVLARRTEDERLRAVRRTDVLAQEIEAAIAERERLTVALDGSASEVRAAEEGHALAEEGLHAHVATLEGDERALREQLDEEAHARVEAASLAERVEATRREAARSAEAVLEISARIDAARAERDAAMLRGAEATRTLDETSAELTTQHEERRQRALEAVARDEALSGRRAGLQTQEAEQKHVRSALDAARERVREEELSRTRAEADRSFLDELCAAELGVGAGEAAAGLAEDVLSGADDAAIEAEVVAMRAQLDAIGPVNLMAIEEFQSLEERHRVLSAQKQDLEESIVSLRESIKRINRSSRERFLETFETIRVFYQEIFKVLFNGGRADLVLEEGEDVLECGIEMIAQPPGKRLGHVSLMSGGEKAMAALALLFAIFRHQPSPFCLLDEVDAALDELNVGRFTRMLSEYAQSTQFILITHNKRSMEAASLLYGVTMEEPGVSKVVSLKI